MFDFKKEFRAQYQPKITPEIIEVPEMIVIAVDGSGDPNTSDSYKEAIEILYGLSYAIKMGNKDILEYIVAPLEGFWIVDEEKENNSNILNKNRYIWTSFIRQPDFVENDVFIRAQTAVLKKKPHLNISRARLEIISEGLCVQAMHLGSWDDESKTVDAMHKYATSNGYIIDMSDNRRHHEIYLSDPRKSVPEKMKTVIRHPVRLI
ncbi:GyrI-like domain-containing protein [Candidatus Symbiopectobacterium sp. NZEC135]|uniref:GyrI-like domain-containing protein n=1 Tax=Candidatus Symbiopectobacterium sp. NZEC135 TaxID=2820471 RepID=UPI002227ECE5|nr:GyrI-like domain-containing protein [Candidatus Symbiopectobacterium sp. NZEC135]MCW2480787.1 GyrI-like domain-containing protein [Candidatus Symbiopectobacterium sp. NZEC135]